MASGNKIVIALLSVSTENSTDQLIEQFKLKNYDFRCVFVKLTQQDLQSFQPGETYDAVILLHSITQGRNSITDVADAKYSKLLPKLKRIYGPDRVAVAVHSITSFNSNTKKALMMVFEKSQPTTFQCSNCVIQCNNLAEMRAEDLSRLTEFLGKVRDHPLPIADKEAHSTLITTPSADKINRIGTGGKPQSIPVSGSATKGDQSMASSALSSTDPSSMSQTEVGRSTHASAISIDSGSHGDPLGVGLRTEVAPTQPDNNQTSMKDTSSADMGDGNLQNMASGASQLDACHSDTAQIVQASSKVDTSPPDKYATPDKVMDTTYPIALFSLSSSKQQENLWDGLQRRLPGKEIMLIQDIQEPARDWHSLEAILVDFGSLQEVVSDSSDEYKGTLDIYQKCLQKMLVPQNVAVLMLAPANTRLAHKHASDIMSLISDNSKTTGVSVFQYGSESCRPSLFDDATKNRLVNWLLDCYQRYHAAALQEGPSFYKEIDASASDNAQDSQAPSKVDTPPPDRYPTQDKVMDTTYPIALFSLSSSKQQENLWGGLQRQLPGKEIILIKDIQEPARDWHSLEAILVDFGSLQEVASDSSDEYKCTLDIYKKCLKKMCRCYKEMTLLKKWA